MEINAPQKEDAELIHVYCNWNSSCGTDMVTESYFLSRAALERTVTARGVLAALRCYSWRHSVRFDARPVQLVKGCLGDAAIRPLNSLQPKTPTQAKVAVLRLPPCNVNDMLQEAESVRGCWSDGAE